ncbi:unnamed protein product [Brassicogethes aeneus]|uniref:UBA domain-containing protein n=1 Tax=Brassicogethes aeneus TaxID=1431903 RepID=A0A9P0B0E2_BRAAE|nr:unnamed protein product [Brassicogethes aeneus]
MSNKQSHDSNADNIKVKISERYKPPHRINLPMSYSQRLNLNKQMQSTIPKYEFTLEKNILAKMKEWNLAKTAYKEERKARLDVLREEVKKKEINRKEEEEKVKEEQEVHASEISKTYSTDNSILMPTQASNILTPIPLGSQAYTSKPIDKSPFNISDFEDDTSSPFDNMALKSINDLEELAQVLKTDDSTHRNTPTFPSMQSAAQIQPSYSTYTNNSQYYVPNMPYMAQTSNYSHTNGYYYDSSRSFHQPYLYNQMDNTYSNTSQDATKSYPDIIKSLETELNNTHINNQKEINETRLKKVEAVYPKPKLKTNVDDFFSKLPQSEQDLCRSISSMGFPPERVYRIIKLLGSDQKKVVDHLLALTDLLDLGFAESAVSSALIQCNNDKDKALDILIA